MSRQAPKDQQGINSIEIGLRVLKELASKGRPTPLSEVAAAVDMPSSKVHRYFVSFIRSGLVQQDPQSGHYDLGPYALELGLSSLARLDALKVGSAVLEPLVAEVNESVFITVWGATGPRVVDWRPSQRPIGTSTHIGTVFPMLASSTGRVYAAYLPESLTAPLIDAEIKAARLSPGPQSLTSWQAVRDALAEIRQHALARGLGLRLPGVSSFSAPVFDYRGEVAFVLTIFGYQETFNADWNGPIAQALRRTVAELSQRLGNTRERRNHAPYHCDGTVHSSALRS